MTEQQKMMVAITASLTTLAETNGAPESMLYIGACGMDLDYWQRIKTVMLQAKMIKISANYVTLTELGKETANKLNAAITK